MGTPDHYLVKMNSFNLFALTGGGEPKTYNLARARVRHLIRHSRSETRPAPNYPTPVRHLIQTPVRHRISVRHLSGTHPAPRPAPYYIKGSEFLNLLHLSLTLWTGNMYCCIQPALALALALVLALALALAHALALALALALAALTKFDAGQCWVLFDGAG